MTVTTATVTVAITIATVATMIVEAMAMESARATLSPSVAVAERNATRYSRGSAEVTDIRRVERIRGGYNIDSRIAVQNGRYRDGRRYGMGWGNDYR